MKRQPIYILLGLTCLLNYNCYKETDFDPANVAAYSSSVNIFADQTSIAADSISTARIILSLPFDSDSTKSNMVVRTDLGVFVESGSQSLTITAKQNADSVKRIGVATLKSGTKTGIAHIQCTFQTLNKNLTVNFTNSYPDKLLFTASTLNIKPSGTATGEINFSCRIFKVFGAPSQNNVVDINVTDSLKNKIGSFRSYNNFSDPSGNTQYTYVLGDSIANKLLLNYYGKLIAIASVNTDATHTLNDTLLIYSIH